GRLCARFRVAIAGFDLGDSGAPPDVQGRWRLPVQDFETRDHAVIAGGNLLDLDHRLEPSRLATQILMDRPGGPLPVCHRLDQVARAKGYVSAGVDAWRRSGQGLGVNLDCSRRRELHTVLGFEEGDVRALPDRENAGVGLDGDDALVRVLWGEAARGDEDRPHLPQVDGAQPPLTHETLRSPTRQKLNTLLASFLELLAALRGPQDGH